MCSGPRLIYESPLAVLRMIPVQRGKEIKVWVSDEGKAGLATGWLGIWEAAPVPKVAGASCARGPLWEYKEPSAWGLPPRAELAFTASFLHFCCLILGASHSPSRCGPEGVLDPGQTSAWNKVVKQTAEVNLNKKDVLLHQFSFKTVSKEISSLETKTQLSLQENELTMGSCMTQRNKHFTF